MRRAINLSGVPTESPRLPTAQETVARLLARLDVLKAHKHGMAVANCSQCAEERELKRLLGLDTVAPAPVGVVGATSAPGTPPPGTRYQFLMVDSGTRYQFLMVDSTDFLRALPGLNVYAQCSIDGAISRPCRNAPRDLGSGLYEIDLSPDDVRGRSVSLAFTAPGAVSVFATLQPPATYGTDVIPAILTPGELVTSGVLDAHVSADVSAAISAFEAVGQAAAAAHAALLTLPQLGWEFFCAHANENPHACPCPLTCGCHTVSTMCRNKVTPNHRSDGAVSHCACGQLS